MKRIFTLLSVLVCVTANYQTSFAQCTPTTKNLVLIADFNQGIQGFTGNLAWTGSELKSEGTTTASVGTVITSSLQLATNQNGTIAFSYLLGGPADVLNYTVSAKISADPAIALVPLCAGTTLANGTISGEATSALLINIPFQLVFTFTYSKKVNDNGNAGGNGNGNGNGGGNGNGNGGHFITFDDFFSNAAAAGAVLPVKFVSLTAKQTGTGTLLTWKVAEEDGVQEYQVERGTNGTNFSRIGSVNASQVSTYTYTDKSSAPVSFYRIKSVDVDGKFGYSTIISLKNGKSIATMKAFPMPAQKQITVQHSMTANNARIMISTGDGRLVKSVIPAVASMQTEVDLSNFQSGLYLLSFEDGNGNAQTLKFIKN